MIPGFPRLEDPDDARAIELLRYLGPYRPQVPAACPRCGIWSLSARAIIPGTLTHWKCRCGEDGIADIAAPYVLPVDRPYE